MERRKTVYDELNSLFGFLSSAGKEDVDKETLTERCEKLCILYDKDLPTTEVFVNECIHFLDF